MHIVEYLDERGKPTGRYAKRFEDGIEEIQIPETVIDPKTKERKEQIRVEVRQTYRDETIPIRRFCVCDVTGKIKAVHEVRFSHIIDAEGKEHCFDLKPGEECHRIEEIEFEKVKFEAGVGATNILEWILENKKMGPENAAGKRALTAKPNFPR